MNEFKIGLGLTLPGVSVSIGSSSWLPRDDSGNRPILYLDLAGNRGWYDGQAFATEALALAAVDGVASGGTRRIGDYFAPEAPELLANGDFAAGIGDWTVLNGATAAIVSGQLEMSGTGLSNATVRSASVATQQGKAYRAKGTYWKGTASSSVFAFPSRSPSMSPPGNGMRPNATTSPLAATRTFAGEGSTHYLGLRTASGPDGTVYGDDFSIREALAFRGLSTPAFAAVVTFRTPTSLPASARELHYNVFGRNGIMGDMEPLKDKPGHELMVVVQGVAPTREMAEEVTITGTRQLFYARLPDVKGTAGGVSFVLDEVMQASPAYRWTLNHTMAVSDPLELFPTHTAIIGNGQLEAAQ